MNFNIVFVNIGLCWVILTSDYYLQIKFDNGEMYQAAVQSQILILEAGRANLTYLNVAYNLTLAFPDYSLEETVAWLSRFWPFRNLTDSFVLADNWPRVDNGTADCFVNLPYVNDVSILKFYFWRTPLQPLIESTLPVIWW